MNLYKVIKNLGLSLHKADRIFHFSVHITAVSTYYANGFALINVIYNHSVHDKAPTCTVSKKTMYQMCSIVSIYINKLFTVIKMHSWAMILRYFNQKNKYHTSITLFTNNSSHLLIYFVISIHAAVYLISHNSHNKKENIEDN